MSTAEAYPTAGQYGRHVDILIPELRVALEFDGNYWHRGKEAADRAKSAALTAAGWHVVRVREEPLHALAATDVVVPAAMAPLDIARVVLGTLRRDVPACAGVPDPDDAGAGSRAAAAEAHLDGLRRAKAAKVGRVADVACPGRPGRDSSGQRREDVAPTEPRRAP